MLDDFWSTAEIAGVALMEMDLWRWMYANPDATPAELKAAALDISRDLWNRYFAPVFGLRDVVLLGVYSHMVERNLYLANYPLGGMIARQIEAQVTNTLGWSATTGDVAPWVYQKISETFVLDVRDPVREIPRLTPDCVRRVDETTLEADISRDCSINFLFEQLSRHNIEVLSMRNKTNRLEQLFVSLVESGKSTESRA